MDERHEHIGTVVIGGGQAGLSAGYHLRRRGVDFTILDANDHVGDSWRAHWDSLRLFTPARFCGLDGMPYPGPRHCMPTKDEFADYLAEYAARFALPVRNGVRVRRVSKRAGRFVVETTAGTLTADNVIVATGSHRIPRVPALAADLDPRIVQLHSAEYKRPSQLRDGGVLIVGAGNSGADIAMEIVGSREVWLAGRNVGHVPFRIDSLKARVLVRFVRFFGHHIFNQDTPLGRKLIRKMRGKGGPLVRVKPKDLAAAGVRRTGRVVGVMDGKPQLEDGTALDVPNVIWATGFFNDYSWIELPVFSEPGEPRHVRGVVEEQPGLFFLGLEFQYAATSMTITGVGRDAKYVVDRILTGPAERRPSAAAAPAAAS